MGSGKSTLGRRLAEHLQLPFFDSDHEIVQQTGVEISVIFEMEGESGFRHRERQMIAELAARQSIVLATGGGAVTDADNRLALRQGFVIFLDVGIEQQLNRTGFSQNRPLLQGVDRLETLQRLNRERRPFYREIADLTVEVDGISTRALAHRVVRQLLQHQAA